MIIVQKLVTSSVPTYTALYMTPEENNLKIEEDQKSNLSVVADKAKPIYGAIFSWIIFPIVIVLILHFYVFQAFHVVGTSMYPTLNNSDYLIISKLGNTGAEIGHLFGNKNAFTPPRGSIIVFRFPIDTSKIFVKRVIGIPGDRVVVNNGRVLVYNAANTNGFNPDTNYEIPSTVTLINTDVKVQPNSVFVMGDNRSDGGSYDSRSWGQVPDSDVVGTVVLRLLPIDQMKTF